MRFSFVPLAAAVALALVAPTCAAPPHTIPRVIPTPARSAQKTMTYPHVEAAFEIAEKVAAPFDYREADVQVAFQIVGGATVTLPAFYDGGATWRARYTPTAPGAVSVAGVTLNGKRVAPRFVSAARFEVWAGASAGNGLAHGFVRISPRDPLAFAFDDGTPYYPLGQNVPWRGANSPEYAVMFARMHDAGENWSRVWMNHWDGKNLDWVPGTKLPLGTLDLTVARRWDAIVAAAETSDIRFQMTLQHHGQYSTQVNSNWADNPWNRANGGFLDTPNEFFTSETARNLTKAKLRYLVARYGYSPAILSWELFNEVQFTDAARAKQYPAVVAWHREMAAFLRASDVQHHLVTTSSDTDMLGLFDAADYVQPHTYPANLAAAMETIHPATWHKPIFFGEAGQEGDGHALPDAAVIHTLLWGSLASEASGAAQFWGWDEKPGDENRYPVFAAASRFVRETDFARLSPAMRTVFATVRTDARGVTRFGPGGGWGAGKSEYTISPVGAVPGIGAMPSFLQGKGHPDLFTRAEFAVTADAPTTFTVAFGNIAKAGAHPRLLVDGAVVAEHDFPVAAADSTTAVTLSAPVPAGSHTITLDNTGQDWAVLRDLSLAPFGPALLVTGKASETAALFWVRGAAGNGAAARGTITVPGLSVGRYRVRWFDTVSGAVTGESRVSVAAGGSLVLATPAVAGDAAVFVGWE